MTRQEELHDVIDKIAEEISRPLSQDTKLRELFRNCFVSTAKTTTRFLEDEETYVFTGDIEAMWLRDSSAQVVHYLPFASKYPIIKRMIKGLLKRQITYIGLDPYANAFNEMDNGNCWEEDLTERSPWVWERKYEVDSLCYPVWLLKQYWDQTGDTEIFSEECRKVLYRIIDLWKTEQNHESESNYTFMRLNCPPSDTLSHDGMGTPTAYTGMTWSGFRPSDDACRYHYLIPSNMFAVVVLGYIKEFAKTIYHDNCLYEKAATLRDEIEAGIQRYGRCDLKEHGTIYAYETDGLGNYHFMDDANVPSLLSIPWLGYLDKEDPIYKRTRAFLLSENNPYYYKGKKAKGIGSPHTPTDYIWHISLTMQGLTAADQEEKETLLQMLLDTDGDTGYMHEGFHADDPNQYTRSWFAWANSLFALFVMEIRNLI